MRPIAGFGLALIALGFLVPYLFLGPTPFNFYQSEQARWDPR